MLTGFKSILLLIITTLLSFTNTNGQNLLTNGDFESGGSGNGFLVSNYSLINPVNGTSTPGRYAWTTNPNLMNSTYISGGDHTNGSGRMLVIDGATSSNQFFWTATSTGGTLAGFTIGTTYTFSFWVKSISNDVTNSATQTTINAFFVNASNYNPSNLSTQVPLPASGWQKVSFSFTANAANVLIRLFTSSTSAIGNDFAVDDFEIKAGALPFTFVSNSSTNPSCPSVNDGTITATASGGSIPYNYALTGSASATNSTGKFTNLLEGTYTVTITDFAGATLPPITGIVLTAPNPLVVSATLPTVCPGTPTTLSVSGTTTGYTWTANPVDTSLTTPNSASITVSPTQTTTYTASTGKTTSATNLINNGDFELGNTDFTSDYITNVNPNPGGIKKAYAIVTNPKSWFGPFSTCPDKTTGTGNMMVADGSDQNGGNDKFWVQNGVSVVPGTDYDFSYYLQSVTTGTPAKIEIYINGVSLGAPVSASSTPCNWEKHTYKWNSGTNSFASIVIYDREISGGGNDFAIDDISLVESVVCPLTKSLTITVNSTLTLNIIDPAPVCSGTPVDIMQPAITAGSTTGTTLTYWTDALATNTLSNPSSITTSGTYYIKSTLGSCSIIKPVLVSINSSGGVPTPGVNPVSYCQNSVAPSLTATPATTATLNWYGINATGGTATSTAPIPSTTALGTIKYYVSQSIGTCESPRVAIDVTIKVNETPTFAAPSSICFGDTLFTLPLSSNNSITGTWLPVFDNTKTDTYTFTPTAGQCATTAPLTITVNPKITPTFVAPSPICSGDTLFTLPPSSSNSIT
ncbi:Ig-like domain-containing protein, partial [Flavobacterium luteum]